MREELPQHFTSDGFPEKMEAFGFLSGDGVENPMYSSYNRVYVPYCTMDMYLLDTATSDGSLQFRGRPLLEEALSVVLGEAATGTSVVLAGSSAGAVGAFNAASWLLETFKQVGELSVVLDSGFFVNAEEYHNPLLEYMRDEPSAGYNSHCTEDFDGGPCCVQFGCMLQRGYYPTAYEDKLSGTFIISSAHDVLAGFQLSKLGTYDLTEAIWKTPMYTGKMSSLLRNLAILYPEDVSVFSPSCFDHGLLGWGEMDLASCVPEFDLPDETRCETTCAYGESGQATGESCEGTMDAGLRWRVSRSADGWNNLQIEGASVSDAMQQWWGGRGNASEQVAMFDTCDGFSCNPTCMTQVLPGARADTDGSLVWVIVLSVLVSALLVLGSGVFVVIWSNLQWKRVKIMVTAVRLRDEDVSGLEDQYRFRCKEAYNSFLSSMKNIAHSSEKQLLFSVDGQVPVGALCAVMGPSGSGKSTLLDLLAARGTTGRCEGEVLFEGGSIADRQDSYIRKCGYMRIMQEVTLSAHRETMAGRLSGGQQRLLALALELLGDRRILFLDEPTSGLDSPGSLALVTILRRLCKKVTIVVSIHQPRPEIWQLFSHTVLVKSGRVVFSGPVVDALDGITRYLPEPMKSSLPVDQEEDTSFSPRSFRRAFPDDIGQGIQEEDSDTVLTASDRMGDLGPPSANAGRVDWKPSADKRFSRKRSATAFCDPNPARLTRTAVASTLWDANAARSTSARGAIACNGSNPAGLASTTSKAPNPFWARHPSVSQEDVTTREEKYHSGCCVSSMADTAGGEGPTGIGIPVDVDAVVASPSMIPRSAPDKILDTLVLIDNKDVIRIQAAVVHRHDGLKKGHFRNADKGSEAGEGGAGWAAAAPGTPAVVPHVHGGLGTAAVFCATASNWQRQEPNTSTANVTTRGAASITVGSASVASTGGNRGTAGVAGGKGKEGGERMRRRPVWQITAILLARARRGGYGMQTVWHFGILLVVAAMVAFSFRVANGESEMPHLVFSMLVALSMPVLFMYQPLMVTNTQQDWGITRVKLADGLYPSVCATLKVVSDHLAVGVVASFSAISVLHAIYWQRFISEIPAHWLGVNIQLSCGATLVAWMMIALFDALAISGLPLSLAHTIGVVVNVG
eukprot:jgi/Undpi1/12844/HiC_scaffold_7.g02511.m1